MTDDYTNETTPTIKKPFYETIKFWVGLVILFLALITLICSFELIQAGEEGVVLRLGAVDRVMDEGFNWKLPYIERVKVIEIRTQKIEVTALAASQDLQDVTTTVALNFNLVNVDALYTEVKNQHKVRLIDPAIQDAVKAATAKFNAEELITKRADVKTEIARLLKERLGSVNINVSEVSIVNFKFSPSFAEAIEKKVTAEQEALEQKNKLEKVKYEAQQKIETAKAEAMKTELEAKALLMNNDLIDKIYAEAQLEAAKKWNGVLPTHLYGSAPIPLLNLTN